ncbi:MAG: ribosome-binding factor A [Patescibacteria group bacterium]
MSDKNLRKERMASVIHTATAEFFVEHNRDWGMDTLVLVEQVFVSPDLHHVEIWISFAPWKRDAAERDFAAIGRHIGELKKWLAERIDLRRFPEIELKLSDPEKSFRIMDILGTISGHGQSDQPNQGDAHKSQEDSADDSH